MLVGIASMAEQFIKKQILTEEDIKEAVEMGAKGANESI